MIATQTTTERYAPNPLRITHMLTLKRTTTYKKPQVGIEPTTARLRIECSTPELLWPASSWYALARTRTATPCGTTPSRWRVYQFHHQGAFRSFQRSRRGSNPRPLE